MNTKTFSRLLIVTILFALAACGQKASDDNRYHSIRPGEVWLDTNGNPIQAHGFQVFYEDTDSMYYWYGENKEFTTLGSNVFFGVLSCKGTYYFVIINIISNLYLISFLTSSRHFIVNSLI